MAKNPRLTVIFNAATAGFEKGVSNMRKGLRRFDKRLTANIKAAVRWGTAITGAATAIGGFMVREQFKALDAVAKTADKLGVQAEALQRLRYAARQSGIEVRTFDMGIQRFRRRVGEAAIGTGEAKDAIKQLGFDAKKLAALPVDQQMAALARAFERIDDGTQRLRLAFKLFDSEGVALLNILNRGEKGITEMTKAADQMGLVFRRFDLAKIETANDALDRMKQITNAVAAEVAVNLTGALTAFADGINGIGNGAMGMRDIVKSVFNDIKTGILFAADAIDTLELKLRKAQVFYQGFGTAVKATFNYLTGAPVAKGIKLTPAASANMDRIAELESGRGNTLLSRVFAALQNAGNSFNAAVLQRVLAKKAGGDAFSLSQIASGKSLASSAISGGASGLRSASELGIVNGQARFGGGAGGAFHSLGRNILTEVKTVVAELKKINRNDAFRSGQTVFF